MEDATGTSRLSPMGQGVAAVKGIAATHPALQLLQTTARGNAAKGTEATTMNEKVHLSLKLVLGHESRLNPSCWEHEHSCEARTRWKTQTTAFCLAAGCRSPKCSCVPGRQRGPGRGLRAVLPGKATRGSQQKSHGVAEARGPERRPALPEDARGLRGTAPPPAPPHRHSTGPPRVNSTFTHVNNPGRDFLANLCRQRLNLT